MRYNGVWWGGYASGNRVKLRIELFNTTLLKSGVGRYFAIIAMLFLCFVAIAKELICTALIAIEPFSVITPCIVCSSLIARGGVQRGEGR
jgi:hypothetical protein